MGDDYPAYGSQVKRPLRVHALRVAAVVLALAGLGLLYAYSTHRDIPVVRVADIQPTMNFATVRVVGTVSRNAYVFDSGSMVFNINDGSGEIAVMGGRAQAEALENAGRLPRKGDRVDVAGSLSVNADREVRLRLMSTEQLILSRKHISEPFGHRVMRLADVTPLQEGEHLTVTGTLKEINVPGPGSKAPYKLTLTQDGSELEVIFWEEVFQGLENKLPEPGTIICASGEINLYQDRVQLKVWEANDLAEAIEPQDPIVASIAEITAEQEGGVFTVTGTLGDPRSIRGGVIYPISDDSGEMVVLFWDRQVSGEERDALEAGVRLTVTAPLTVYKGTLELIPENADSFRVETEE